MPSSHFRATSFLLATFSNQPKLGIIVHSHCLQIALFTATGNLFAKKNCYLFCITVTHVACSHAFFALSFVFLFAHFSIRCCNQRCNEFFLPGKLQVAVECQPPRWTIGREISLRQLQYKLTLMYNSTIISDSDRTTTYQIQACNSPQTLPCIIVGTGPQTLWIKPLSSA